MSFKRILVAVDSSKVAVTATQIAIGLGADLGARVATLFVVDPEIGYGGDIGLSPADLQAVADGRDADILARLRQGLDLPADTEHFVRIGPVADIIDKTALDWFADLIVIGSHGRTGLGRLVLGSVSDAVIHKATCPVLVIREPR